MGIKSNIELKSGISVSDAYSRVHTFNLIRSGESGNVNIQFLTYKDAQACEDGKHPIDGYRMELSEEEFNILWGKLGEGLTYIYSLAKNKKYMNGVDC
jgi:hypothetical protein